MSRGQNGGSLKDLAVVPGSGNENPVARSVLPACDGTIASAWDLGISREALIDMTRLASMSDPRVARFLDAWDGLDSSEKQARGAVYKVCEQIGLAPVELLTIVADVGFRFAICGAQVTVALALPSVVERSIETALTPEGIADRKMLFLHSGFLPTPKTSQTAFSAMRSAEAGSSEQTPAVLAPSPEQTIRTVSELFNKARGLPRTGAPVLPERASGRTFPDEVREDGEGDGE
jgi:hypothetical protein